MNPGFSETYYLIDNLTLSVPTEPALAFYYDDRGHRIRKENFVYAGDEPIRDITWYVRDASGSPLAIYQGTAEETQTTADLKELPIYGLSRLGIYRKGLHYIYQLTDHLGNVRATLRLNKSNELTVVGATDYYPFGMSMPGRSLTGSENYRYAYQGQEKDPETGKEAFQLRLWDSRIGRWLITDPKHAGISPYWGMNNNPISVVDPDGGEGEDWILGDNGTYYWDPNITSEQQAIDAGLNWVGKTLNDVYTHFNNNLGGWDKFMRDYLGSYYRPKIDYVSYYKPEFRDIVIDLLNAETNGVYVPEWDAEVGNYFIPPIDLRGEKIHNGWVEYDDVLPDESGVNHKVRIIMNTRHMFIERKELIKNETTSLLQYSNTGVINRNFIEFQRIVKNNYGVESHGTVIRIHFGDFETAKNFF